VRAVVAAEVRLQQAAGCPPHEAQQALAPVPVGAVAAAAEEEEQEEGAPQVRERPQQLAPASQPWAALSWAMRWMPVSGCAMPLQPSAPAQVMDPETQGPPGGACSLPALALAQRQALVPLPRPPPLAQSLAPSGLPRGGG
jgi:hypothetical protein